MHPVPTTDKYFALLRQLVETESPSHNKTAVDRLGEIVSAECRRLGAQVKVHPREATGDLIEASFAPIIPSKGIHSDRGTAQARSILLLCHMDTVFPLGTLPRMPYLEKDGMILGPGVSDMKGGIVVVLATLEKLLLAQDLPFRVIALFTPDEEIGSHASRQRIEELAGRSSLVLVLEPGMPDGALKTWRKGVGEFNLKVHGRAAHAGGDHRNGLNAIEEIAHQVLAIQGMTCYDKGTTLNVGVIRGGIASNVVPDHASIEVDLRVMEPGEAERITTAMQALKPIQAGTSLEVVGGLNRPPMPANELIRQTFEKIKQIASEHGMDLKASGTGGASDANFVAPLGIPLLDGLGPAGGDYHSEREYILKASLLERIELLSAILTEWDPA